MPYQVAYLLVRKNNPDREGISFNADLLPQYRRTLQKARTSSLVDKANLHDLEQLMLDIENALRRQE